MADEKISDLTDAGAPQSSDQLVIARTGSSLSLLWSSILSALNLGTAATHAATDFDSAGAAAAAQAAAEAASQPVDADLTAIAGLDSSTSGAIASDGSGWIKKTYAQFKTALSLVSSDVGLGNVTNDAQVKASIVTTKGDIITATGSAAPVRLGVGADTYVLTADSAQTDGIKWAAASGGFSNPMTTKGDIIIEDASPAPARLSIGSTDGQVLNVASGLPAWAIPPGYEINYTQITTGVNVTGTSGATATTIISPGAITFDGAPVIVTFFTPFARTDSDATSDGLFVTLWESAELAEIGFLRSTLTTNQNASSLTCLYRFTPTAASHTYILKAWSTSTTGTPQIGAGAGGSGVLAPAFIRFTKV